MADQSQSALCSRMMTGARADRFYKTFGLNRMDLLQREGKYPLPADASKTIMGVEFAGTVTRLGEGIQSFVEGDEVFGLAYGVLIQYVQNFGDALMRATGRVCRVYSLAGGYAAPQAEGGGMGRGCRTTRELDDR